MSAHDAPSVVDGQLERAVAFVRGGAARTADLVRSIDAGLVLSTPSLPDVWWLNRLRISEPLTFAELIELANRELAGLAYRDIGLEHQASGRSLEASFKAARWKVERDVVMVLAAPADPPADTSIVIEPAEDDVLELIRRWFGEDQPAGSELEQLVEYARREARVLDDRLLGVRSGDGRLVAMSKLRSDGRTAQVEDVYTVPEARGRGFARALVSRAVELARADGHDLIFIVADDDGWPKHLYGRLGFRPVGHLWQFHRD
jgi:GNAT superfamily N-acetyltransferase